MKFDIRAEVAAGQPLNLSQAADLVGLHESKSKALTRPAGFTSFPKLPMVTPIHGPSFPGPHFNLSGPHTPLAFPSPQPNKPVIASSQSMPSL